MDKNLMEIKEADVVKHYTTVFDLVRSFSYSPKKKEASVSPGKVSDTTFIQRQRRPTVGGAIASGGPAGNVSLLETITSRDDNDPLTTEVQNHILRVIRRGIAISSELVDVYGDSTNLKRLQEANKLGKLNDSDRVEFQELLNTSSLIGLFVAASYVSFMLSDYMTDSDAMQISIDPVEEILLDNPWAAFKGIIWELDSNLKKYAQDDVTLVRITKEYFNQLIAQLLIRKNGVKHIDVFNSHNYRVETDKFDVAGFDTSKKAKSTKLVMNFVKPEQVVGNHVAKYQALKAAKTMALYDFGKQRNPVIDVAGFSLGAIGDGVPGTGKCEKYEELIDIQIDTRLLTPEQNKLLKQYLEN